MPSSRQPPLSPSARLRMDVVSKILERLQPISVVEVGPGQGASSYYLARGRDYVGYEPDLASFKVAEGRLAGLDGAELANEALPAEPTRSFEALVAFEVLEHIHNDLHAVCSWAKWIRPGGHIIISVPAKAARFGPWDEAVGHYRRYELEQLNALLGEAGFDEIEIRTYGMPLGYFLEWIRQVVLARRLGVQSDMGARTTRSGRAFQPNSGEVLIRAATYPFVLMQRPFENSRWGIGWVAVARHPG